VVRSYQSTGGQEARADTDELGGSGISQHLERKGRAPMRKLVVCNIMSLDGYDEGPGNNVMVLPMDASFDEYNLERIRAADAVLLGRTSYQASAGSGRPWPTIPTRHGSPS
jgi:hypothetical protein